MCLACVPPVLKGFHMRAKMQRSGVNYSEILHLCQAHYGAEWKPLRYRSDATFKIHLHSSPFSLKMLR